MLALVSNRGKRKRGSGAQGGSSGGSSGGRWTCYKCNAFHWSVAQVNAGLRREPMVPGMNQTASSCSWCGVAQGDEAGVPGDWQCPNPRCQMWWAHHKERCVGGRQTGLSPLAYAGCGAYRTDAAGPGASAGGAGAGGPSRPGAGGPSRPGAGAGGQCPSRPGASAGGAGAGAAGALEPPPPPAEAAAAAGPQALETVEEQWRDEDEEGDDLEEEFDDPEEEFRQIGQDKPEANPGANPATTPRKKKDREKKKVEFAAGFQPYEEGLELERVKNELRARLGDSDFPGRASIIDALKGPLVSEIPTAGRKEHWLNESGKAVCKGVHCFEQYSDGLITGDPVFLYRTGFKLMVGDVEARISEVEATLGTDRNSERARLAIRLYRKLSKLLGGAAQLALIWEMIVWYTGKSFFPDERAEGHKNAKYKTLLGAFFKIFGKPESLKCKKFACFETEEEAYLAEKAAILLPYNHDEDGFPTSACPDHDKGDEGRLCRFVLNAAAGGGGKAGRLRPANLRAETHLFPVFGAAGAAGAAEGAGTGGGNSRRVVAIKLKEALEGAVQVEADTEDAAKKDCRYWKGEKLKASLPESAQREFRVFESQVDANKWVRRIENAPDPYSGRNRVTFILRCQADAGNRESAICTEIERPATEDEPVPTYWTFARTWSKTVVEYLLIGERVFQGGGSTPWAAGAAAADAAP